MKIEVNAREFRRLSQMRARAAARERVKAAQTEPKVARPFPAQQKRRERDASYLGWLHEGLPCIACLVLGETHASMEAAHQKINAPERGIFKRLGVRPSDHWTVPLCVIHHRTGSPCCDPAQAKFWAIVGLEPFQLADFCRDLHAAFTEERDGAVVVRDYASLAAGQRSDAA